MPSAITSIRIDGRVKTIRHYCGDQTVPVEVRQIEKMKDDLAGSKKWVKGAL